MILFVKDIMMVENILVCYRNNKVVIFNYREVSLIWGIWYVDCYSLFIRSLGVGN